MRACVRACVPEARLDVCFATFVPRQMDTLTTRVDAQLKSQVPPVGIGSAIQRAHLGGIVCARAHAPKLADRAVFHFALQRESMTAATRGLVELLESMKGRND